MNDDSKSHSKDRSFHLEQWSNIIRFRQEIKPYNCEGLVNNPSIWKESFTWNISWICIDRKFFRDESMRKKYWSHKREKNSFPTCRWCSKIVWKRLWIPRTHSKARTYCVEGRSQWRTSRRIGRASTNRIKRWRWSPEWLLVNSRWLHLSTSYWTSGSTVCAEERHISNSTEINILTWQGRLTRIWTSCKRNASTTIGMSTRTGTCQIPGLDSQNLLCWRKTHLKDMFGPGGDFRKFKRPRDWITCGQKYGPTSVKQRRDEKGKNGQTKSQSLRMRANWEEFI